MGFSPVQLSLSGEKLGKEALVRFDCHCHRLSIGYSKPQRTYCCKRCGMPLSYEMISFNPVVQDRSGAQDAEQDLSEALSRIDSLGADLYATRQRIGDLEAAVSDRDAEVLRLKQQLQEAEQESSRRISEAESEKANLSAIADNLVASRNSLQRDLDDLNATNAHLRRECDDLRSIPVRQSTEAFLEFMSAVYNASFDKKSFESLAKTVQARTEHAISTLDAAGIIIAKHERGSAPGSDRVDIDTVPAADKDQDGRVCRSSRFGCRFSGDLLPMIPERLAVYSWRPSAEAQSTSGEIDLEDPALEIRTVQDVPEGAGDHAPVQ